MIQTKALLQEPTKKFLSLLRAHPEIRHRIRAAPNRTLLYAGSFFKPMWKEIEDYKRTHPEVAHKETLNEVLRQIVVPGTASSLFALVEHLESEWKEPKEPQRFIVWRALSGIFASNATGSVSFQIGSAVTAEKKAFAATEVGVLLRNPKVDANTKDLLAYFQRCIQSHQADINLGFISA
jgi:hypothetical protein